MLDNSSHRGEIGRIRGVRATTPQKFFHILVALRVIEHPVHRIVWPGNKPIEVHCDVPENFAHFRLLPCGKRRIHIIASLSPANASLMFDGRENLRK
jgi:hypothetical protein